MSFRNTVRAHELPNTGAAQHFFEAQFGHRHRGLASIPQQSGFKDRPGHGQRLGIPQTTGRRMQMDENRRSQTTSFSNTTYTPAGRTASNPSTWKGRKNVRVVFLVCVCMRHLLVGVRTRLFAAWRKRSSFASILVASNASHSGGPPTSSEGTEDR